jgi:hypothetical protein
MFIPFHIKEGNLTNRYVCWWIPDRTRWNESGSLGWERTLIRRIVINISEVQADNSSCFPFIYI